MRAAELSRTTAETDVRLRLELDGTGLSQIATGCGFLDHMLTLFARHGRFDLSVQCTGDTNVDDHHTVEDIGICLGDAFSEALGDKRGTVRYGSVLLPMDEALILTAVDLSGRGMLYWDMHIPTPKVGSFDTELAEEFFIALARRGDMTIHIRQLAGSNSHHIIEGAFKGLARSLSAAAAIDSRFPLEIPSTKGVL
ncbi:MAG: imidazoleglycerol-phosphate dehydratase HisB [Oscillospiraceae bacterium]|jgi:imidazoleglycerol-phosphate dehydratase|nr:imidazoleglycerol-phosphate dehydratase HisB [Oscillospiraceae bacterium]